MSGKLLVGQRWHLRRISKPHGFDHAEEALDGYTAELTLHLGIARRSEGRAQITCFSDSSVGAELIAISVEIDHAKTRGPCPWSGPIDGDGDSLCERFECVLAAFERSSPSPTGSRAVFALLCSPASSPGGLGDHTVEWIERRFDCFCSGDGDPLDAAMMSRTVSRWTLISTREADAKSSVVSISARPPHGIKGISEISLEFPLSVVSSVVESVSSEAGDPTPDGGVVSALADLCRTACGIDLSMLVIDSFATPVASLTCGADVEFFSHRFALPLLRDLAVSFL